MYSPSDSLCLPGTPPIRTSHTSARCLPPECNADCPPKSPFGGGGAYKFPARPTCGRRAAVSPSERRWTTWHSSGAIWLWPDLQPAHVQSAGRTSLQPRHNCAMVWPQGPDANLATSFHPWSLQWGGDCRLHEPSLCRLLACDSPTGLPHNHLGLTLKGPNIFFMSCHCLLHNCLLLPLHQKAHLPFHPWYPLFPPFGMASSSLRAPDFFDLPSIYSSLYPLPLPPYFSLVQPTFVHFFRHSKLVQCIHSTR